MIQVDLPAAFTLGQGFAILSQTYLKKEKSIFTNRLLGPFNIYLVSGFCSVGMFLLTGWPAWESMYKWNWIENTYNHPGVSLFYISFLVAMVLLGNLGYMLGHYFYIKGRGRSSTGRRWVVQIGPSRSYHAAANPVLMVSGTPW